MLALFRKKSDVPCPGAKIVQPALWKWLSSHVWFRCHLNIMQKDLEHSCTQSLKSKDIWNLFVTNIDRNFQCSQKFIGMWYHDEFLRALETFVNVCHNKISDFFIYFFSFTVHQSQMSLGAERHFRRFCVCLPWFPSTASITDHRPFPPLSRQWRRSACRHAIPRTLLPLLVLHRACASGAATH